MTPRLPLLALGAAALLTIPAVGALRDLRAARADRDTARADDAAVPVPIAVAAVALPANDAADARSRLAGGVRVEAGRGGVLVESMVSDAAAPPALAAVTIRVSGSEKAVTAFADALERRAVPVRMAAWRMTAAPGGVRLDARLVAPWRE